MPLLCACLGPFTTDLGFCCWHGLIVEGLWLIPQQSFLNLGGGGVIFTQLFQLFLGSVYLHQEPVEPETPEGVWWANGGVHAGHPVSHPPRRACD